MQLLSIKLVCLFIIFGGLQPTQLSALYGKFFEMLVLSSNSDYHPNKKKYFLMFLEQTQQWIFMIIKICFGSIFPPKKIEVGSHPSFCWTWPRMACCDICSIWICSHRLFFISGHDSHNWHNLRGIRTNFVTCYEYRYYTSAKYKRQINSILKFLVSLRANHPKCRQLMFKRCKWCWSNFTCTKRVLC